MWMILGGIIGYFVGWRNTDDHICGLGVGFVGVIIGLLIWFLLPVFCLPTTEKIETKEIYALTDSSELEGSHYLFSGYVNGKLVYRYIVNTDKGKKIETVNCDNAYFVEGAHSPKVEIHTTELAGEWCHWLSFGLGYVDSEYLVFYVPENSITTEYNVDLK